MAVNETSRKRKKQNSACDFCKRRKVKCDKGNPCSSCLKYKNPNCIGTSSGNEKQPIKSNLGSSGRCSATELHDEFQNLKSEISRLERKVMFSNVPSTMPLEQKLSSALPNQLKVNNSSDLKYFVGYNPIAKYEDAINFHNVYASTDYLTNSNHFNLGPLSWISLQQKDAGLRLLSDFMDTKKRYIRKLKDSLLHNRNRKEDSEGNFRDRAAESCKKIPLNKDNNLEDGDDYLPSRTKLTDHVSLQKKAKEEISLLFDCAKADGCLNLIQRIKLSLPNQRVIWKLIKRFFDHLYHMFPFLDEFLFKKDISNIIGSESFDEHFINTLKVEKKLDFARLGLLLIILRLGYLSLFANNSSVDVINLNANGSTINFDEMKYLVDNPIRMETIDVAQICLDQFNTSKKINISVIQLALFMRLYHIYGPENGDGTTTGDIQVCEATIIQMAYSVGLHREPDNLPSPSHNEKMNHLGRKIWYHLLMIDIESALTLGIPLKIQKNSYDTRLPTYEAGNENISDIEMEKASLLTFSRFERTYSPLSDVLLLISKVGDTNSFDLSEKLDIIETDFIQEHGTINSYISTNKNSLKEDYRRILEIKDYLAFRTFLLSIIFHFYNFYEASKNFDLTFYYLKKILVIIFCDLIPLCSEFSTKSHSIFRGSADLFITPIFELAIHKSFISITSITIRIKSFVFNTEDYENHSENMEKDNEYKSNFNKLCKISKCLENIYTRNLKMVSKLKSKYYYAWKIEKAHSFFLDVLTSEYFYLSIKENSKKLEANYTADVLDDLIKILENSRAQVLAREEDQDSDATNSTFNILNPAERASYLSMGLEDMPNKDGLDCFIQNGQIDIFWLQTLLKNLDNNGFHAPDGGINDLDINSPYETNLKYDMNKIIDDENSAQKFPDLDNAWPLP